MMEPLVDTDHHRDESLTEEKLAPPVSPVPKLDSHDGKIAREDEVLCTNGTELVSDDENDIVPKLGSPFRSPKPRSRFIQNDISSTESENNISLENIQSDMPPKDFKYGPSPTNGDGANKYPIAGRLSTNARGILIVSDSSLDSFDTLVPTPDVHQKVITKAIATIIVRHDIDQGSTIIEEDVDQDPTNISKEIIEQDAAVITNEHMDQDPTINTKGELNQDATTPVINNTEPNLTVIREGVNISDDDTETVTESVSTTKPTHSVPPHMRPDFQPPAARQYISRETRQATPIPDGPRVLEMQRPRREHYGNGMQNAPGYRSGDADREQVARLSAQLMKTQNELNAERKRIVSLRITIEAEQQVKTEAALSAILNDLLQKQIQTFTQAVKNDALVRDLQFREQKAAQLEIFLAEGQKQFTYELDARGLRPISAIEREQVKRATELALRKDITDAEAKLATQLEGLRVREATQSMREQQYKALIRASLEQELKLSTSQSQSQTQQPLPPSKAAEIAELEYNCGYAAGKSAAQRGAYDDVRKKGWVEGYAACHRSLSAIADLKAGRVELGSPALEFLWDAGHEGNLFGVGMKVAGMVIGGEREKVVDVRAKEVVTKAVAKAEVKVDENIDEHADEEVDEVEEKEEEQTPAKKHASPPAPPTFASQLRGKQAMHNGHVVLAGCSEKQKEDLIDLMG